MSEKKQNNSSSLVSAAGSAASLLAKKGSIAGVGLAGGPVILPVFLVILALMMLIAATSNAAILYDTEPTKTEYIIHALEKGFVKKKREASGMISSYVSSKWNCGSGGMSSLIDKNRYVYSTDACEITIEFTPDLEDFAYRIDSRAVAVNSALQYFEEGGSKDLTESENSEISSPLTIVDDEGSISFTEYGKKSFDQYNDEYANNQSEAYFRTLERNSEKIFSVEEDKSAWAEVDFHIGKKEKQVTACYVLVRGVDGKYHYDEVACEVPHDKEEEVTILVDAQFGTIYVPMRCNEKKYKDDELSVMIDNLVGKQLYFEKDDGAEKKTITDSRDAGNIVDQFIAFYVEQYAALIPESVLDPDFFNPHVIEGDINYLLRTLGLSSLNEMMAEIRDLQHRGLILGDGSGVLQCTEFVSYVTYKLYGYNRYPGSDGIKAASILQTRGWSDSYDSIGRGTILSRPAYDGTVHGHTMIVLGEIDGNLIIADANRDHKGGISIYYKDADTLNASVAGRLQAATPPEGALADDSGLDSMIKD